jgi:hypothetical protein
VNRLFVMASVEKRQGYLFVKENANWKKLWFELEGNNLKYFTDKRRVCVWFVDCWLKSSFFREKNLVL